jgi:hypothetical protein
MSRASGRPTATTYLGTHGENSATRATELAGRHGRLGHPGDGLGGHDPAGPPDWPDHRAGQHLDVRLTAEDGYTAEREYSIASAPGKLVAITVERLEDGEVSPYLTEELRAGDELELRGPGRRLPTCPGWRA